MQQVILLFFWLSYVGTRIIKALIHKTIACETLNMQGNKLKKQHNKKSTDRKSVV